MKPILTLSVLLLSASLSGLPLASQAHERAPFSRPAPGEEARLIKAGPIKTDLLMMEYPRADFPADAPQRLLIQQRYSIDEAINLVEQRTGGRYVSGSQTGPSTFVIKVQIGPNIVTYKVDLSNRSMSKA